MMTPHEIKIKETKELCIKNELSPDLTERIIQFLSELPVPESWSKISKEISKSRIPFSIHWNLYKLIYSDWNIDHGPPPAWIPDKIELESANLTKLLNRLKLNSYQDIHQWSVNNRVDFWKLIMDELNISFKKKYSEIVDISKGYETPNWLVDTELNIVDSCFQSPGEQTAILFQKENQPISKISYQELLSLTNRVANSLKKIGFMPGDAIAIIMPLTVESVAIYLGIIKAGGIVVSIADSFSTHEMEIRLQISNAKAIFIQDHIIRGEKRLPLYEKIQSNNSLKTIVIPSNDSGIQILLRSHDIAWSDFLEVNDKFQSVSCKSSDFTNILFSSGTTGEPKAIPWTQTTPIKCAMDAYLHHNIQPGDILCWPTNLGWMMGPWLIYASLINHATMALYYGLPMSRGFGRFIQDAEVTMLGVVPTLVRHWKETQSMEDFNWEKIKCFSSTGECSNPEDMFYLMHLAGYKPVIEYCGGTEIGGGYITGTMIQPQSPATFSTPALGLDFIILDEEGKKSDNGEIFLIPPSIGLSTGLLNKDHHEVYFKDTPYIQDDSKKLTQKIPLRRHGDHMEHLGKGYYRGHGRIDDTMNLGGIKISSIEIEQILNLLDDIDETAAIAISPSEGGPDRLVIYTVLKNGYKTGKEELKLKFQELIKKELNPLFKIADIVITDSLPRTASNKMTRRVLRDNYIKRKTESLSVENKVL